MKRPSDSSEPLNAVVVTTDGEVSIWCDTSEKREALVRLAVRVKSALLERVAGAAG